MRPTESQTARTRKWDFGRKGGEWTINDKIWNKERVDADRAPNDVEIWKLENESGG